VCGKLNFFFDDLGFQHTHTYPPPIVVACKKCFEDHVYEIKKAVPIPSGVIRMPVSYRLTLATVGLPLVAYGWYGMLHEHHDLLWFGSLALGSVCLGIAITRRVRKTIFDLLKKK
jgi:hypothetical protein